LCGSDRLMSRAVGVQDRWPGGSAASSPSGGLARLAGGVRGDAGGGLGVGTGLRGADTTGGATTGALGERRRVGGTNTPFLCPEAAAIRRDNLETITNARHHSLSPPRGPGEQSNPGLPTCSTLEIRGYAARAAGESEDHRAAGVCGSSARSRPSVEVRYPPVTRQPAQGREEGPALEQRTEPSLGRRCG
jgi:hypothetical protein